MDLRNRLSDSSPWLQSRHISSAPSVVWSTDSCSCLELTLVSNGYREASNHMLTVYQMAHVLCHHGGPVGVIFVWASAVRHGVLLRFVLGCHSFSHQRKFADAFFSSVYHCYTIFHPEEKYWGIEHRQRWDWQMGRQVFLLACSRNLSQWFTSSCFSLLEGIDHSGHQEFLFHRLCGHFNREAVENQPELAGD